MKELTFETMLAVFEDLFGFWLFWALVAVAAVITALYIYVLIRDRHVGWRKFLIAQVFMPVGAVLAIFFVLWVTNSRIADLGGPIDAIIFLGIAALGAVGIAILVYTVESLLFRRRID
jgi:glucan phosphoethanolaminetransferase (alkaline phosphatase superfamily)